MWDTNTVIVDITFKYVFPLLDDPFQKAAVSKTTF